MAYYVVRVAGDSRSVITRSIHLFRLGHWGMTWRSDSPHPVQDVTKQLAKERNEHYSEASVRALIHQARKRGLLTRSPRGQAGGQLTDKAVALLAGAPRKERKR